MNDYENVMSLVSYYQMVRHELVFYNVSPEYLSGFDLHSGNHDKPEQNGGSV